LIRHGNKRWSYSKKERKLSAVKLPGQEIYFDGDKPAFVSRQNHLLMMMKRSKDAQW
jgi:hypothetical protein